VLVEVGRLLKLRGVYYITHIENLPSILERGILCHRIIEEEQVRYTRIYDPDIVRVRKAIRAPNNKTLWDFVNLYFQPRNAMLYRVIYFSGVKIEDICIIGLKNEILNLENIYVTDGNAVSANTKIYGSTDIHKYIKTIRQNADKEWWANEDGSKRQLMAECLVPNVVLPEYISEIYVPNHLAREKVEKKLRESQWKKNMPVIPQPDLFFQPTRKISLTDTLSLLEGDMFFSRRQTLTVSVNTVGVMGKGVASRAKYQFPDLYVHYQDLCRKKFLKMGCPYLYKREISLDIILADESEELVNSNLETWFLLFPTKTDWRKMADIKGIEEGLSWIVKNYKKEGIKSLALPALGCGLGGLSWGQVGPIICTHLKQLDIEVDIYLPLEYKIPEEQLFSDFLLK